MRLVVSTNLQTPTFNSQRSSQIMDTRNFRMDRKRAELAERTTTRLVDFGLRVIERSRQRAASLVALLAQWQQRARDRALLREMDARALRDLGLTRADVLVEADKPSWRLSRSQRSALTRARRSTCS
jgi:uncharacterized protein YjiS (DUF1127 family)